jgi:hypothetical protein
MRLENYINYFKSLAASHVDLNHSEDTGEQAFACISIEELYRDDNTDILKKMRSKFRPQSPLLIAIKYIWNGYDANSQHEMKALMGGFCIIAPYQKDNTDAKITAETLCESIIEDIIAKIIQDSKENIFWEYSVQKIESFAVTPFDQIANYSGWQVIFEFSNFLDIKVKTAKWQ